LLFKWRIFSQPGKIGTGKNARFLFFLLGLKYTLSTFFESKNVLPNPCPELSNQVLSFQPVKFANSPKVVRQLPFKLLTPGGQKSVNLRYITVGRLDDDMIVPPSDGAMFILID
jgi:hypothetical protein